jgi:predicted amidophosphoribosyltransferase
MGCLYKIICPNCGKEFEWNEGPGAVADVLHCDKCGKELWTTEPMLEFEHITCACGGTFDKEVPIICPHCRQELNKPRKYIKDAVMWD